MTCHVFQSPIALSSNSALSTISRSTPAIKYNRSIHRYEYDTKEKEWNNIFPTIDLQTSQDDFTLTSFHIHQPGEHTLDGQKYDLEIHFLFQSYKNKDLLVLGFLAKQVCSRQGLKTDQATLFENLVQNKKFKIPKLSPHSFWRYTGSLTGAETNSNENVNWIVSKKILKITREELQFLLSKSRVAKRLQNRSGRDVVFNPSLSQHDFNKKLY